VDGSRTGECVMAATPEGKVKKKLKEFLRQRGDYQHWPVLTGYGEQTLDCISCVKHGWFFGYECKRKGIRVPTPRQAAIMKRMRAAGGKTYVVTLNDNDELEFIEIAD
jgi:hypothetical protein